METKIIEEIELDLKKTDSRKGVPLSTFIHSYTQLSLESVIEQTSSK